MGLMGKQGYCYASNKWLGMQLSLKEGTTGNIISSLVEKGILKRSLMREKETGQIKERRLYIHSDGYPTGFTELTHSTVHKSGEKAVLTSKTHSTVHGGGIHSPVGGSVALEGIGNREVNKLTKEKKEKEMMAQFDSTIPLTEQEKLIKANKEKAKLETMAVTRAKLEQLGILKPKK
jgi:hypothetical protein